MSDNSTRWQRVVSQSGEKPRFQARQTTDDLPPPPPRTRSTRLRRRTDLTTLWWIVGVVALSAIAIVLAWLVFFA